MDVLKRLEEDTQAGILPTKYAELIKQFYDSYVLTNVRPLEEVIHLFYLFIDLVEDQVKNPYIFEPYHKMITKPINYHKFGVDVIKGVVSEEGCSARGLDYATEIEEKLARGDNVVLVSNHQSEGDPQAFNILLKQTHPYLAQETIFVAGERVLIDPMAAPFSMGCNLLCVYSKKYIENPPEKKQEKRAHNVKAMKLMFKLFEEGGKVVWVAPAGGRDRPNADGEITVVPFDPQAIEVFRLIAKKCSRPVHFYPLALSTHHILPPPMYVEGEKWEPRYTKGGPIHLAFGPELDLDNYPGSDDPDREKQREARVKHAWSAVNKQYATLPRNNNG